MGFTRDAFGKPVFAPTPTQTVTDLQEAVDFAKDFAWVREGTAAERGDLTTAQMPDGLIFTEVDTGWVWLRRSGTWVLLFSNGGVHRIRPASVSGTNVTIGTDGAVQLVATPAGATVQIRDIFSPLFRNYLVKASWSSKPSAGSVAAGAKVVGIVGTAPVTPSTHSRAQHGFVGGVSVPDQGTAQVDFGNAFMGPQGTAGSATSDIIAPNVPEPTFILSQTAHVGGVTGVINSSATLNSSDQLTGLQLNLIAGGTWTGELRFYGLA